MNAIPPAPHPSLIAPVRGGSDRSKVFFREQLASMLGRHEEQLFLDTRSQRKQVHDLRQPSPAHMPDPGQFRLVGYDAVADELV